MPPEATFWIYVIGYFGWFAYGLWQFRRAPGDEIVQVALALIWPLTLALYLLYLIGCLINAQDTQPRPTGTAR